ncbi:putative acetyl-CoA acetyltransferase [Mycobacterium xenopi 3993]|nr:putative acetyl-CoA acetyltransferase [Mycobacterium xenopi 3993]
MVADPLRPASPRLRSALGWPRARQSTNTGVGRLRPGQSPRRAHRRRTRRLDGRGCARSCRAAGPRGRRLHPRGESAVGAIPRPGLLLAHRIGADKPATRYSGVGGNVPQSLVNQACLDIRHGRADVVLIAGAETWRTRTQLKAAGRKLVWTQQDESVPIPQGADDHVPMAGRAEERIKLDRPAYVYPLFEQALRISNGEPMPAHRRRIGELWARFNAVAVNNPHAWIRKPIAAEDIWRSSPENRMISWPYTKLMNSNNMVDQSAALVLASAEAATRLKIPVERWVYPYAGTDAHDTYAISERPNCTAHRPSDSPARVRSNWPASASTTSTMSICIPAFRPRCRSRRPNWDCRWTTRPGR